MLKEDLKWNRNGAENAAVPDMLCRSSMIQTIPEMQGRSRFTQFPSFSRHIDYTDYYIKISILQQR